MTYTVSSGALNSTPSIVMLCDLLTVPPGLLVCRIEEEHLWESKQLGAHSPYVLLNTLVYFNTKHFMLRTPAEHLALSFSHIMKHWKKTSSPSGKQGRSVYLRYYSPAQSSMYFGHTVRAPSPYFLRRSYVILPTPW